MKKTTREFGECRGCDGKGAIHGEITVCNICRGSGREVIKETIEETDDMKEFIEKKCGWELVEEKVNEFINNKTDEMIIDHICSKPLDDFFKENKKFTIKFNI